MGTGLGLQLTVPPYSICGEVCSKVGARRDARWFRIAGLGHIQQRAGLGVTLTEEKEVKRVFLWDDDEVRLHIPKREAWRWAGKHAGTASLADGGAGGVYQLGHLIRKVPVTAGG
jgi:hypothetical protein